MKKFDIKKKTLTRLLGVLISALGIVFVMTLFHQDSSSNCIWEVYSVPENWVYFDDVLINTENSTFSVDDPLFVTIRNESAFEIEFLPESISLQKKSADCAWMVRTSNSNQPSAGAEIQKFLLPGESIAFSIELSNLIPDNSFVEGTYRLFLPFTYQNAGNTDPRRGEVDISYGYCTAALLKR